MSASGLTLTINFSAVSSAVTDNNPSSEIVVFSLTFPSNVYTASVVARFSPSTVAVNCNVSPALTLTFSDGVTVIEFTTPATTLYLIVAVVPAPTHVSTSDPFPDIGITTTSPTLSPAVLVFNVT